MAAFRFVKTNSQTFSLQFLRLTLGFVIVIAANHVVDYGHMRAVKFVIGEDATCPEVSSNTKTRAYCNGPLKADTWYEVRMRAFTEHGYSDSVAFSIKTSQYIAIFSYMFSLPFAKYSACRCRCRTERYVATWSGVCRAVTRHPHHSHAARQALLFQTVS